MACPIRGVACLRDRHQSRRRPRRAADPETLSADAAFAIRLRARLAVPTARAAERADSQRSSPRASATAGPISSSRGLPACWVRRPGHCCLKRRRSACSGRSARPSQRCSACRRGRCSMIEPHWGAFMHGQIAGCRARHERLGLSPKFLAGFDDLLRDAAELIPMNAPPVILTGEYIPENFLLAGDGGEWRLAGLIDFGDVMTGWGEYDLLGPSAFMAAGRAGRVESLFEGFGYSRCRHRFRTEAPADGADAAAPGQRSGPAHLHRGLAGSGARSGAASGFDLAGLIACIDIRQPPIRALLMSKDAALYAIGALRAELRSDRICKFDHWLGMNLKV